MGFARRAVECEGLDEGLGFTAVLSEEIWPDHPEKVLAFTEEFSEANPNSVKATLKALHEASIWCDDATNHDELATLLAAPPYLNCPAQLDQVAPRSERGSAATAAQPDNLRGLTFSGA